MSYDDIVEIFTAKAKLIDGTTDWKKELNFLLEENIFEFSIEESLNRNFLNDFDAVSPYQYFREIIHDLLEEIEKEPNQFNLMYKKINEASSNIIPNQYIDYDYLKKWEDGVLSKQFIEYVKENLKNPFTKIIRINFKNRVEQLKKYRMAYKSKYKEIKKIFIDIRNMVGLQLNQVRIVEIIAHLNEFFIMQQNICSKLYQINGLIDECNYNRIEWILFLIQSNGMIPSNSNVISKVVSSNLNFMRSNVSFSKKSNAFMKILNIKKQ